MAMLDIEFARDPGLHVYMYFLPLRTPPSSPYVRLYETVEALTASLTFLMTVEHF